MFIYGKGQDRHPFLICLSCPYSTASQSRTSKKPTLYEVLDVSEKATLGEIRDAFITKSKELHPDMNPHKPELHESFVQINNAYSVLSNATQRLKYDLKLREIPITQPSEGSPFGSVPQHRRQSPYSYYYEKARDNSNYRQTRPHDFATGSQSVVNSAQRQKSNKLIMMGAIAFMLIGATVQYFFIRSRHNVYRAQADESSRKAHEVYTEVRERARANGLKKQLELFVSQHSGLENIVAAKALQQFFGDDKK